MAKGRGSQFYTREDLGEDDVERFNAAKDKILLDGGEYEYERDDDDEPFGGDEREVLGFDDDNEQEASDGHEDFDDDAEEDSFAAIQVPKSRAAKSANRRAPRDDAHEDDVEPDEEEDLGWGASKHAYYSGNTERDMESDSDIDEEKAHELETNEAIRLQRLSRTGMGDHEFGLENIDAEEAQMNANEHSAAARMRRKRELDDMEEVVVQPTDPETVFSELRISAPIVLALVPEYKDALQQLEETHAYTKMISVEGERQVAEIAHLYYQTLSTYVMLLAFFFQMASSPAMLVAANTEKLLSHPVMDRLSQFKKALVEMKSLGLFDLEQDSSQDDREMAGIMGPPTEEDLAYEELGPLEPNEVEDLIEDEKENQHAYQQSTPAAPAARPKTRKPANSNAKKRKAPPTAPASAPLALVAHEDAKLPPSHRSKRLHTPTPIAQDDAYGEPVQLLDAELDEKMQRKRASQFHADVLTTAQSAPKRNTLDGDADIPYRDRRRSRDAVAAAKSSKLAKEKARLDPSLNEADWGDGDWQDRDVVMGQDALTTPPTDDYAAYYDLVTSGKRAKTAQKKAAYDEERLAGRIYDADVLAPGEHRTIDRTIEKNRGLTPSRSKAVRNPRVKRRMKFDRAQKRLSSTRAVYKGGQGALQGGYQGEKSGISTGLVKSRKLSG
ncbi:hypothetical protein MVES_001743 [Malassezia vespertilionis]|uniref:Sas10 C-terminal domain-containing protein n=1 Tax=Malassezia vespertilionis TaxID=2020962 RepID=A0A2N1JDD9_9BASI|nr:hypothetical protein MVES_001743 [Malassezia vespertilionis]